MNLKRFVYICSVWRNYQQKMSLNRRPLVACCTVYSVHIRQMDANKCCSTRKGSGSSSWSDEIICGVVRKFSILVGNIDEKSEDTANVFKWYHKELRTITPTLRMIPNTCCIQQHLRMIPQTFKDNTANICGKYRYTLNVTSKICEQPFFGGWGRGHNYQERKSMY